MPPLFPETIEDDFGTSYAFFMASGRSVHDCAAIGQRFYTEVGFRWDTSESWVLRVRPTGNQEQPDTKRLVLGGMPWLTRVWMSPQNHFWVSSIDRKVHQETDAGSFTTHQLPSQLMGVWGFHDRCVYAWSEADERIYRWDGARWHEMPCPGKILVMAGRSPDDLLASGYDGDIWRWDGQVWTNVGIAFRGSVAGLFVTGPDRAYASTLGGDVPEISPYGAQRAAQWDGPLLDVTGLGGDLLLAAGDSGLLRLAAGAHTFEGITTDFTPERFDNQNGVILISAGLGIVQTTDAEQFGPVLSAEVLRDFRRNQRPLF